MPPLTFVMIRSWRLFAVGRLFGDNLLPFTFAAIYGEWAFHGIIRFLSLEGTELQEDFGVKAAETGEGAGSEAARGDAGLAASFSDPSFFGLAVLSEFLSAVVCLSLSE